MDDAGEEETDDREEMPDTGEEHGGAGVGVNESVKVQQKRLEIIKPLMFLVQL